MDGLDPAPAPAAPARPAPARRRTWAQREDVCGCDPGRPVQMAVVGASLECPRCRAVRRGFGGAPAAGEAPGRAPAVPATTRNQRAFNALIRTVQCEAAWELPPPPATVAWLVRAYQVGGPDRPPAPAPAAVLGLLARPEARAALQGYKPREHFSQLVVLMGGPAPPRLPPAVVEQVQRSFAEVTRANEAVQERKAQAAEARPGAEPPAAPAVRRTIPRPFVLYKLLQAHPEAARLLDYVLLPQADTLPKNDEWWAEICGETGWDPRTPTEPKSGPRA